MPQQSAWGVYARNRLLGYGIAFELVLILLIVYTPWGNLLFGTVSIGWEVWLYIAAFMPAMLLLEELRKAGKINRIGGSPTDGKSMIWPMKVFHGAQPYDPENRTLVTPHTAGNDDTAYWKNFGWEAPNAI